MTVESFVLKRTVLLVILILWHFSSFKK